jgi:hypothetical protein
MLLACIALGLLAPTPALAHVKWFTDPAKFPLRTDLILSERTLLWIVSSALTVLALALLQRRLGSAQWPRLPIFDRMAQGGPTILAVQAAIPLIAAAAQWRLLVPNLALPHGPGGLALAALEAAIAFTFVTGIADWVGAIALIALLPLALTIAAPLDVLDHVVWVGIGIVVLVIGRGSAAGHRARPWFWRRDPAWSDRAVACLRVATGVALIATALDEKLLNPELGRAFMANHADFNVFHTLFGTDVVSNDLFVLMIGLTEAAIGAALVSGRLTRLVVLGAWLPFHLGIPLLPSQELIGHLPIFGIMYVLLVHRGRVSAAAPAELQAAVGRLSRAPRRPVAIAARPRHMLHTRRRSVQVGFPTQRTESAQRVLR